MATRERAAGELSADDLALFDALESMSLDEDVELGPGTFRRTAPGAAAEAAAERPAPPPRAERPPKAKKPKKPSPVRSILDPIAGALANIYIAVVGLFLRVAQRFITPSPEAKRRMKRDQAAFDLAFARDFEPPLFRERFAWPREDELTGRFGDRRVFNGQKLSQHYGVDVAGQSGDPVAAANDGLVVLVRDCYASGKSVVVWHGAGLYSVYFHLSRFAVKEGARVRRGDLLGRVGKTGRVHCVLPTSVRDLI